MSKQPAASPPTHLAPTISLLLTNLHLLDLDRRDDWPSITAQIFTIKNNLQNEKIRIQCVEWAFYRLFELWDPVETKDKLGPFFPALVPLQSLNLRAALFRCLNELKKNGILGKDVIVRKTFFDDCKGERVQELLNSFSTLVLRKVLAAGHGGRSCIAARLATAKTVTAKDQRSFLPLAVAHRASLTAILQKKKDLRERYKNFGHVLDTKGKELDRRFEAVVSTQDFLDKNPVSDHTVARVSKLFEKNWQGDRKPLEVIMEGEDQGMKDELLDKPFSETWQQVSAGTFDGATGTNWQGLLQDLEERVANQEARLANWRNFKEAMQRDGSVTSAAKTSNPTLTQSPSKDTDHRKQRDLVFSPRKSPRKSDWKEASPTHPKRSRKENTQDELKERDLVFSPRKSPRKSMWPVAELGPTTSAYHSQPAQKHEAESGATENGERDGAIGRIAPIQLFDIHTSKISPHVSPVDDTDDSDFSEISEEQIHSNESQDHRVGSDHVNSSCYSNRNEASSTTSHGNEELKSKTKFTDIPNTDGNPATPDDDDSWISSLAVESTQEHSTASPSPDEDEKLAEQIVSMTLNAAPTPAKPKASLMERTRQSMAFASPIGLQNLLPEGYSSSTPSFTRIIPSSKTAHPTTTGPNDPGTLLERTRRSISHVPSKKPRKSTLDRRTSKYPTNQFETPKRQLEKVPESTPPEELFSPGAGYDSVFKSRPKIALSPNPSPSQRSVDFLDARDERDPDGGVRKGQREGESPLARMTGKV